MQVINYFIVLISLFIIEILYFKIAFHFKIFDKPNDRSSHNIITIRGGGIIFFIAGMFFFFYDGLKYPYFFLGLFLISLISFLDDVLDLNRKARLVIHFTSVLLLFYQWNLFTLPWYWLIVVAIFVIGTINAYNFMDGINGITGSYSLVAILTLFYVNNKIVLFTSNEFLVVIGISLLIFNFFNFRMKAKCFAGDVGSVSIAFILIFLIGQLILKTHNFNYILLLLCYGLDTTFTIFFRKIRKQNIFVAHRHHFYQYLANERKLPHLWVSAIYFAVQLILNVIVILWIDENSFETLLFIIVLATLFFGIRLLMEGRSKLFKTQIEV